MLKREALPLTIHFVRIPTMNQDERVSTLAVSGQSEDNEAIKTRREYEGLDKDLQPYCDTLSIDASHLVRYTLCNFLRNVCQAFRRHQCYLKDRFVTGLPENIVDVGVHLCHIWVRG